MKINKGRLRKRRGGRSSRQKERRRKRKRGRRDRGPERVGDKEWGKTEGQRGQ